MKNSRFDCHLISISYIMKLLQATALNSGFLTVRWLPERFSCFWNNWLSNFIAEEEIMQYIYHSRWYIKTHHAHRGTAYDSAFLMTASSFPSNCFNRISDLSELSYTKGALLALTTEALFPISRLLLWMNSLCLLISDFPVDNGIADNVLYIQQRAVTDDDIPVLALFNAADAFLQSKDFCRIDGDGF